MKLQILALALLLLNPSLTRSDETTKPPAYTMSLVMLYAENLTDYEWVITLNNSIGFKSIDGLKTFLRRRPRGTTILWDPGCCRLGDEPLLNSAEELQALQQFCQAHGIELTVRPSG